MFSIRGHTNNLGFVSGKTSKRLSLFVLASVVSGVNWFIQNQMLNDKNEVESNLIKRVANDQTAEEFNRNFNRYNLQDWNCKRVSVDAQLEEGRFVIKRNRGNEEGYFVMAPVTIAKDSYVAPNDKRKYHRKFIVNMGWIPKTSKHMILKTCQSDALGQNDYTLDSVATYKLNQTKGDNFYRANNAQSQLYSPVCTINAYVRTGEKQNKARGWSNFKDLRLFKFIDLEFLSRVFRFSNVDEASTVYFDRIAANQQQSENLPLPTSKEQLIADLKENIQWNQKEAENNIRYGFLGSYAVALLLGFI